MAVNYELKSSKRIGEPKLKEGSATIYVQKIRVNAGVVGDTYGFTKTRVTEFEFDNTDSFDQQETKAAAAAAAFVAIKYPDIV